MPTKSERIAVTVRLDRDVLDKLNKAADKMNLSRSDMVNICVRQTRSIQIWLEEFETPVAAYDNVPFVVGEV